MWINVEESGKGLVKRVKREPTKGNVGGGWGMGKRVEEGGEKQGGREGEKGRRGKGGRKGRRPLPFWLQVFARTTIAHACVEVLFTFQAVL